MRKALIREIAPDTVLDWVAPNHSPGGALLTGGLSSSDRHSSCYGRARACAAATQFDRLNGFGAHLAAC